MFQITDKMFLSAMVLLGILSNKARLSGILGAYEYINQPRPPPSYSLTNERPSMRQLTNERPPPSYSRPDLSGARSYQRNYQSNDKEQWLGTGSLTDYQRPELRTNINPTQPPRDAIIDIKLYTSHELGSMDHIDSLDLESIG